MIELIAEISTNHGGSVPLAKEFIKRFADAGADWIKFQYTRVKHLRPDDPQYDWFKQAELSDDQFAELKAETEACGAKFLLTVYNADDNPDIVTLGCDVVKLGAGEQSNHNLLLSSYSCYSRVIRSVDFAREWAVAEGVMADVLCAVTRYPASKRSCERAIALLAQRSGVHGYSDHSIGTNMATWAMECGATIIEKHVQLEHQARPCRPFEATVSEFKYLRKFADDDPSKFVGRWQYA